MTRYALFPQSTWNVDEGALTTTQKSHKIEAEIGICQVRRATYADSGRTVATLACVSPSGNKKPPITGGLRGKGPAPFPPVIFI